jgi:methyltransferase (TIGR00027 family)
VQEGAASATARGVAAYRLRFERVPLDGGRPEDDDRLQRDVAAGVEVPADSMERYLRSRTAFVDRAVVDAVADGIRQFVSVGAGFDGRALRYGVRGSRWFELDHPDTQREKIATLGRLGLPTDRITFVPADLNETDPGDALVAAGFDVGSSALFTCEGVSGYLTRDVVASTLDSLSGIAAAGCRLAIEMPLVPERADDETRRADLRQRLGSLGEPLVSAVPRAELRRFMADNGWTIERAADPRGVDLDDGARNTAFVVAAVRSGSSGPPP